MPYDPHRFAAVLAKHGLKAQQPLPHPHAKPATTATGTTAGQIAAAQQAGYNAGFAAAQSRITAIMNTKAGRENPGAALRLLSDPRFFDAPASKLAKAFSAAFAEGKPHNMLSESEAVTRGIEQTKAAFDGLLMDAAKRKAAERSQQGRSSWADAYSHLPNQH